MPTDSRLSVPESCEEKESWASERPQAWGGTAKGLRRHRRQREANRSPAAAECKASQFIDTMSGEDEAQLVWL